MMNNYMLCQDCLRVIPYDQEGHEGKYKCQCGGDLCGCSYCNHTITLLMSGELRSSELDLLPGIPDLKSWNAEDGGACY